MLRFFVGILLIIGCAIFIGCPVKLFLRITAGDLSAVTGLIGLIAGVYVGLEFIENGFRLGEASDAPKTNGLIIPVFMIFLLVLAILKPSFIAQSDKGSAGLRHHHTQGEGPTFGWASPDCPARLGYIPGRCQDQIRRKES